MWQTLGSSPAQKLTRRSAPVAIRKIDETSTNSWFQRAPAPVEPKAGTSAVTAAAAHARADGSQDGWDPMEVWLRHIDQPRRLRQGATPTDTPRRG
jgi:hypothetical protein